MKVLEKQAPFLTDAKLLSDQPVRYSCPLDYKYAGEPETVSALSQRDSMFLSRIGADTFISLMDATMSRLNVLEDFTIKIIRTFRPEPNKLICRWNVSFEG